MTLSSRLFLSLAATVALLSVGCAHSLPNDLKPYVGTWRDLETDALTKIIDRKGELGVESIIDRDGEVFVITKEAMEAGHFMWSYHVPSTNFDVTIKSTGVEANTLKSTWSNATASGEQDFERVETQTPVEPDASK